MNATIGIYDNHDLALAAVKELKDSGFPVDKLSIIGKAETEEIDENLNTETKYPLKLAGLGIGTALGTTLGVLAGVGIFAIPGLGFLFGAGAIVGAIAGFDFGLIGGGIASVLETVGVNDANMKKYHDALEKGKFVVIAHGKEDEVIKAKILLQEHGTHHELDLH